MRVGIIFLTLQLAMSHHITPNLMLLSCLAVLHTACEQRLDTLAELFQLLRDTSRYIRRATDDCTTGSATDVAFNVVLDSAPVRYCLSIGTRIVTYQIFI